MTTSEWIFRLMIDTGEPCTPYFLATRYHTEGKYDCGDVKYCDTYSKSLQRVSIVMDKLEKEGLIRHSSGHTYETKINAL